VAVNDLVTKESRDQIRFLGDRGRMSPELAMSKFAAWRAQQPTDPLPAEMVGLCPLGHAYLPGVLHDGDNGRLAFAVSGETLDRIGASNSVGPFALNDPAVLIGVTRWTLPCPECTYRPTVHWVKVIARAAHSFTAGARRFALLD
jgi:hypothetical protein